MRNERTWWGIWLVRVSVLAAPVAGWGCKGDDTTTAADDGGADGEPEAEVSPDGDAEADAEPPEDVVEDDGAPEADAADPCAAYPCGPYGTDLGEVLEDWSLQAVNGAAGAMSGGDDLVDMHDFYALTEAHGGTAKALLIFVTSVWCPYCAVEADLLDDLYRELHPLGVEFLGLVLDGATPGEIATAVAARTYAMRHRWSFPTVVVSAELYDDLFDYWPPEDRASGEIGVPLHLFYDLRGMRMYGRFAGAVHANALRAPLREIAESPQWVSPGRRRITLDCAPGTGTETEPNSIGESPEDGTHLPYALSGVQCPPVVGDGLFFDEDDIDLGTLEAGAAIDVEISTGAGTGVYPLAVLLRVSGSSVDLMHDTPWVMGPGPTGRQFLIDRRGRYFLAVIDGRLRSTNYYGPDLEVPAADGCCVGGPDHTYDLAIAPFTLEVTDDAVAVGTSAPFTLDDGDLNVHPFDVTGGTSYAVRMEAVDRNLLNTYLVVYDPAAAAIRGANDDEDAATGNTDSLVRVAPAADGRLWIVAGYTGASFRAGPPAYTIRIE